MRQGRGIGKAVSSARQGKAVCWLDKAGQRVGLTRQDCGLDDGKARMLRCRHEVGLKAENIVSVKTAENILSVGQRQNSAKAVEKGRDPTPSEKHLHVHTHGHTHGHAGKSFVVEQSRVVHERSQEILHQQTQTHSDDGQTVGGEKKRRVDDLESQTKCYYGPNLPASSGSDATSPATPLNVQLIPIGNLDELLMQLIPILMDHMLPIFVEGVRREISSPSHQSNTHTNHPSVVAPTVPAAPTTANIDKVHASVSDDDRNSPASH